MTVIKDVKILSISTLYCPADSLIKANLNECVSLSCFSFSLVLGGSYHRSGSDPHSYAASADDAGRLSQSDFKCG